MGFFEKTEEEAYEEAAYDIDEECAHGERAVEHAGTPFPDEVAPAGAYKTATTGDEHCFNHNGVALNKLLNRIYAKHLCRNFVRQR